MGRPRLRSAPCGVSYNRSSEMKLQYELKVASADRSIHDPTRDARRISGIRSVLTLIDSPSWEHVGGVASHREDRRVEGVDCIEAEFDELTLREGEPFREAH